MGTPNALHLVAQPGASRPPWRQQHEVGLQTFAGRDNAGDPALFHDDALYTRAELELHLSLPQALLHGADHLRQHVAADVLLPDRDELDAVRGRTGGQFRTGDRRLFRRGAVFHEVAVHLVNQSVSFLRPDEFRPVSADQRAQVELAVRHAPGTAHASRDTADVTINTVITLDHLARALSDVSSLLDDCHVERAGKLVCRQQPPGAGSHDDGFLHPDFSAARPWLTLVFHGVAKAGKNDCYVKSLASGYI